MIAVAATTGFAHHTHDHVGRPRVGNTGYARRNPEHSVLYKVVQEQLETFLAQAAETHDPAGVPKFVENELRAFLDCGVLARGFARWHCGSCGFERLVDLSCKGRGFCPSCGGKRMTGLAADLTDRVMAFTAAAAHKYAPGLSRAGLGGGWMRDRGDS